MRLSQFGLSSCYLRCITNRIDVGIPVQLVWANAGAFQVIVVLLALPLNEPVPWQSPPVVDGVVMLSEPVNDPVSTAPVTVPWALQLFDPHDPVTVVPV